MFDFEGISMINYFTDNWQKVQDFCTRPDDILIATYPKAGVCCVLVKLLECEVQYLSSKP